MIFIGDIHADFNYYLGLVKNITHTPTVQVGDFGIGFPKFPYPKKIDGDHWFIRGNHDNPAECKKHPNYLGDYGYHKEWNLFYCGGADSIDKEYRVWGVNWWEDEEQDYRTLNEKVLPLFEATRPRLVVTHTCPTNVTAELRKVIGDNGWGTPPTTRTEHALQAMFEVHQPELWVFGHFHRRFDYRMDGTRFVCLNTYQIIDVEGNGVT